MKPIDTTREGPLNDLLLAINHYVSTGNRIGDGVALEDAGGYYQIPVAFDPKNPDDDADMGRFRKRLTEITEARPDLPVRMDEPVVRQGQFLYAVLHVRPADLRRLAADLVRSPGAAGWGTWKPVIDAQRPEVRGRILSGEWT